MHSKHETVTSPMGPEYEKAHSGEPSGHVGTTDDAQASVSLPRRSPGALVREVVYDNNADLPVRSISGGKSKE